MERKSLSTSTSQKYRGTVYLGISCYCKCHILHVSAPVFPGQYLKIVDSITHKASVHLRTLRRSEHLPHSLLPTLMLAKMVVRA